MAKHEPAYLQPTRPIGYGSAFRCFGCGVGFSEIYPGNACPLHCGGQLVAQQVVEAAAECERCDELEDDVSEHEGAIKDLRVEIRELEKDLLKEQKENSEKDDQIWNLEQDVKLLKHDLELRERELEAAAKFFGC